MFEEPKAVFKMTEHPIFTHIYSHIQFGFVDVILFSYISFLYLFSVLFSKTYFDFPLFYVKMPQFNNSQTISSVAYYTFSVFYFLIYIENLCSLNWDLLATKHTAKNQPQGCHQSISQTATYFHISYNLIEKQCSTRCRLK